MQMFLEKYPDLTEIEGDECPLLAVTDNPHASLRTYSSMMCEA